MDNQTIRQSDNQTVKQKSHIIYFDVLNILATLAVIAMHANAIIHGQQIYTNSWRSALIFEVFCYWAVPVFLMISGANLIGYRKHYDTKTYFKKRISKIILPWVVWSLFFFIRLTKSVNPLEFIKAFFLGQCEPVFWFFPLILYVYCIIPIIAIIAEKEENRKLLYGICIFICFFQFLLQPILGYFSVPVPYVFSFAVSSTSYLLYPILGYLLATMDLKKAIRWVVYISAIIATFGKYFFILYYSRHIGTAVNYMFSTTDWITLLQASAIFIFVKQVNWEKVFAKLKISTKFISTLSSLSFGVYLSHMMFIYLSPVIGLDMASIYYRTFGILIIYILSTSLVFLIKKIPFVRKIVP